MARYSLPSNEVSAGNLVLPKDSYVFSFGAVKTFKKMDRDNPDEVRNYGVSVPLTIVSDGPFKNKTLPLQLYWHNEGSQKMTKRVLMAAQGFGSKQSEEEKFNEVYPDLWIDCDTGEVSDAFARLSGKVARANVDVQVQKKGQNEGDQQNNFRWEPLEA